MEDKLKIKNRNKELLAVVIDVQKNQKGLAFIMHGLSGFKEQGHIKTFAEAFISKGFTIVLFDTRNTFGESQGNYEDANITNYFEDLEDVINWAKKQKWYQEPFYLVGHSLGGICIMLYAENFPEHVKAVAPISTVVSGRWSLANYSQEEVEEWEKTGWRLTPSYSKPGITKKLKWHQFRKDILKYDAAKKISELSMPVLLMVGEEDKNHKEDQKRLYKLLPGKKELHVIKGAEHTFNKEHEFKQIKKIFIAWIDKVEKNC